MYKVLMTAICGIAVVFPGAIIPFEDIMLQPQQVHYEYVAEDMKIMSTVTIDDDFLDDRIVVVLTRRASRNFGEFTISDFPEVELLSVSCQTPGLELAQIQIRARNSRRPNEFYYDPSWSVNLSEFRRILVLMLAEPSKENVLYSIRLLEARLDIRSAEPEFFWKVPTEEYSNQLQIEPFSTNHWAHSAINLAQAHAITRGTPEVLVGVVSLGVNRNHPVLVGRDYDRLSYNPFNNASPWQDIDGHGTFIAGIIAGQNGVGIAPNTRLVSLKVGNRTYYWSYHIRSVIVHASNPHSQIRILSISTLLPLRATYIQDSIRNFPGLVVVAAGNDDENVDQVYPLMRNRWLPYPNQNIQNLMLVGASDSSNTRAWFFPGGRQRASNTGRYSVDLFAPGTSVESARLDGSVRAWNWGTSWATPHVAGVAALMLAVNPLLTAAELRSIINATVTTSGVASSIRNNTISGGILNAYRAVRAAQNAVVDIRTPEQLYNIRLNPAGNFRLVNNIDLGGRQWMPIPNFTGVLDGRGHEIHNMTIMGTMAQVGQNVGLFATNHGNIHSIRMVRPNITVVNCNQTNLVGRVGAIVGSNFGTVNADVWGGHISSPRLLCEVGGLVGINAAGGYIRDSRFQSGSVTGVGNLGGIAGINRATIRRSMADWVTMQHNGVGAVRSVGGIVGLHYGWDVSVNTVANSTITLEGTNHHVDYVVGRMTHGTARDNRIINTRILEPQTLFNEDGTINPTVAAGIVGALNANNTVAVDRMTEFRLFPDTGSGHVLALSRLMWRVVHVDGDRVTLWAAGAYRNSVFHSHLHSDPGSVNGTALPLYRYSDLRNNVLGDWVGLVSLLPISQHVLAQGTDTFGANPNDPLWIPSFSGEANLGAAWGMTEQLRSFDRNGFSINAWSRQRGQNTFSLMNVFTFEGEAWTRTGTFESSVRPALHLSLGALIG